MFRMIARLVLYLWQNEWVTELLHLANEGNAEAQTVLGVMHYRGDGVL